MPGNIRYTEISSLDKVLLHFTSARLPYTCSPTTNFHQPHVRASFHLCRHARRLGQVGIGPCMDGLVLAGVFLLRKMSLFVPICFLLLLLNSPTSVVSASNMTLSVNTSQHSLHPPRGATATGAGNSSNWLQNKCKGVCLCVLSVSWTTSC